MEQSYHKIEDIRTQYIKIYGSVESWGVLQYTFLLNSDTEITALLEEHGVTLNKETQNYGITLGMLMIKNEIKMMFYDKHGTTDLDMNAKEEMYNTIYDCALDYWIHGTESLND